MDTLCMRTATGMNGHGLSSSISVNSVSDVRPIPTQISAVGKTPAPASSAISVDDKGSSKTASSKFSFNYPFRSLLFGGGGNKQSPKGVVGFDDAVLAVEKEEEGGAHCNSDQSEGQDGNWVLKILHVKSLWSGKKDEVEERESECEGHNGNCTSSSSSSSSSSSCDDNDDGNGNGNDEGCDGGCRVCDDDGEKVVFNRDSFSRMLKKMSLAEAKLYAQMSYLGNLAYAIPSIKSGNLLKRHGLRFVTSSIEKREQLALAQKKEQLVNDEVKQQSGEDETKDDNQVEPTECDDQKNNGSRVSASTAFQITASAASFLYSRSRSMLHSRNSKDDDVDNVDGGCKDNLDDINSEMASLMATTDSVTAVVAAKEEVKQAVADDLNSISSAPCEWYICDDEKSATRFFVIQGSETLASWQANLLFEPIQFEGLDVFVHRGIYEAAKGMYQQMLPEVHAHMNAYGKRAKFRFTGHSLGGSLSLLINLMLLIRGEVPYDLLLPVITFGSPCIMCGGDELLIKLGLPKSHVQSIVMHRDIVPRAFSCKYPRTAAQLLKAINGNFRNHPCLNHQKLLYAPMGEMLILQPDAKISPQHDLLPSGIGLYLLTCKVYDDVSEAQKQLRAAKNAFLNTPHPLEILSDRSAYGHGGTIHRDHDMNSYLKCIRTLIRQELNRVRKAQRERRRKVFWWPLVNPRVVVETVGTTLGPTIAGRAQFNFSGILKTGGESLKRFSRLVASQHMHLLVVLLFPARLLLIGAYSVISPR